MNTITRLLHNTHRKWEWASKTYPPSSLIETRLASSRKRMELPDSTCHRKRLPPVEVAISYDDTHMRLLSNPEPPSTTCFVHNIQSPSQ